MRQILSVFIISLFLLFGTFTIVQYAETFDDPPKSKQTVLVELFTAQGCPGCPAAEKMLAELENEQPFKAAELVTLAFHVDYWDGTGWKDEYASPLFTQRQKVYDRKFRTGKIYTPQMVVDGDIEFIGSKMDKAEKAVEKTLKNVKADVGLSFTPDEKLKINITNLPEHKDATVYLAVAEDGIVTRIKRGENAGKDLEQVSLVRTLNGLGRIMPGDKKFELETFLQIQADWKRENLKIVVFIQENGSRDIKGVNFVRLQSEAKPAK